MELSDLDKWRSKWRERLRDLNFWLDGYSRADGCRLIVRETLDYNTSVYWNAGVGPAASFTRAISSIVLEGLFGLYTDKHFDPVIKVQLIKEEEEREAQGINELSIETQLALAVAKELRLLDDDEEYNWFKKRSEEVRYYSYGTNHDTYFFENHVSEKIAPRINEALSKKRYLLVVENLYKPCRTGDFPTKVGLPPPRWNKSKWVLSTTSLQVREKSTSEGHYDICDFIDPDYIMVFILFGLQQAAKYISKSVGQEDEAYWHRVALRCLHYAMLLLPQNHVPPQGSNFDQQGGDGDYKNSRTMMSSLTSDELIRQWVAQGILTTIKPRASQENIRMEDLTGVHHNKYHDIYQVGNVILQTFHEYSLLELPFSPATNKEEATQTAAHFLAYHGLTTERIEVNKPFLDMEHKKWIKLVGRHGKDDQILGWHVNREWLTQGETTSSTTLILRHFPHTSSSLLDLLDHLLPKLPALLVLDLSYTPLESLPPSVWCLSNLKLLSLRGCRYLRSLCSSSNSGSTLSQKDKFQMNNLVYLDLTLVDINIFPCDFFQGMTNLEELVLVNCSNLVELPHSMASLSSLLTLEVTGTKLKSIPDWMFAGMQQLQSLKLADNKLLISLPRSISKVHGLKEFHILGCNELEEVEVFGGANLKIVILSGGMQHFRWPKSLMEEASHGCLEELRIEGWASSMQEELELDGHPTLKSFSLINAPGIRHLSMRKCRKLECVELRDIGVLESLDLSATAIKELPADIPNLPQLRRLILKSVPSLRRFPWHKLQRLPDVFCMDQCVEGIDNYYDGQVTRVCINDPRIFHSFNSTTRQLVLEGKFFQSFYVQVASCKANFRRLEDEEDMVVNKLLELARKKSPYNDVYCRYMEVGVSIVSIDVPPIRQTVRHVEMMSTRDQYTYGLYYLLQVTKSINVIDDTSTYHLTDLNNHLEYLEECQLWWCHKITQVFSSPFYSGERLQNVLIYHLKVLTCFYESYGQSSDFRALKHLHLEDCPRLEKILPCGSALPSLMTVDILFCYNLKTIFYDIHSQRDSNELPSLRRMRLQELPLLQHLRDNDDVIVASEWKELHVRGCRSLRRLPRLRQEQPSKAVEVNGESAWWNKLSWDPSPKQHRSSYKPKLPPVFASLDEHVVITSYLR